MKLIETFHQWRSRRLLERIHGRYCSPLPAPEAVDRLRTALELWQGEARAADMYGAAGALVRQTDRLPVIVIGDLHARVDHFLQILRRSRLLQRLEAGRARLLLLGDAIHPDRNGELASMESSVLMMDLIFGLKCRYGDKVQYLLGNHDSFNPHLKKAGIAQSQLWYEQLHELRGAGYCALMQRFYETAPLVYHGPGLVACHAGPPFGLDDATQLVNAHHENRMRAQLMWTRLARSGIDGYGEHEVQALRRVLKAAPDCPVVVGHTRFDSQHGIWMDVDNIAQHHVLYSAHRYNVSWLEVRHDGQVRPFVEVPDELVQAGWSLWREGVAPA